MKVKNIMFSGFAAAILMGVGAANAINGPVTLADTGYVDEKVNLVAGQKEAVANKMNATTAKAANLDTLATDEANYPSVAAAVEIADKKASSVLEKVNANAGNLNTLITDVATLKGDAEKEGSVAHSIAAALKTAEDDATVKADKALADAKTYADGKAAEALEDAREYTDTKVGALGTAENVVAYVDAKAAAAQQAAVDAANAAAENAIATSGHALASDVARDYETKENANAKYDTFETKENANAKYDTFETKENATAQYATFETTTNAASKLAEAKGYTDSKITDLNVAQYAKTADVEATYETKESAKAYAKTADVTAELAKKLDKTAINNAAGTYMVTSDGNGKFTYTKVLVATGVAENGDAVVTE